MRTLQVEVPGERPYPIHIGAGALRAELPDVVRRHGRELVVVITNETLARLYPDGVADVLRDLPLRVAACILPDGEQFKTLDTLTRIYDRLMALEAHRNTLIVAFGGGVVGDTAGFAAATFMRGLPLVQVPTTLLAQVDSSVGGKTAVNHREAKNAVGAFKQPAGVVMDMEFLATLPPRELTAGLFELVKHGMIRDAALFEFLEARRAAFSGRDWSFWEEAVFRSCRVKAAVVQEDPRETDQRAILNFGHSLGHLLETHTGYETFLHGEAVGVGMLFASFVSRRWGHLVPDDYSRIRSLLLTSMPRKRIAPLDESGFTRLLMHDKKAAQQSIRFILLGGLGKVFIRERTTPAELWPEFQRFLAEEPDALAMGAG
ncbi:MAG: 3-dehydroquinate synthase [Candidatus Lambdaproteobacteria bacterium]|nr:3-dehydroquinate synthase [Candidatus Lambdaproteobacteria bacterium]